ncbi:MAG: hypothetical protein U0271_33970 [Polyangiaceae bacterium]
MAFDGKDEKFEESCHANKSDLAKGEEVRIKIRPARRPPKGEKLRVYLFDDHLFLFEQPYGMLATLEQGFYAETTVQLPVSSEQIGVLELAKYRETYQFRLPEVEGDDDVHWAVAGPTGPSFWADLYDTLPVGVAFEVFGQLGRIALTGSDVLSTKIVAIRPPRSGSFTFDQSELLAATLVPRGKPEDPTAVAALDVLSIRFSWNPKDLYEPPKSKSDCPTASLVDRSQTCSIEAVITPSTAREKPRCVYRCDVGTGLPLALPAKLHFSLGVQQDEWEDTLARVDQQFDSSPNRDQREFPVRLPWDNDDAGNIAWQRRVCSKEGMSEPKLQSLAHVDLFAPDGKAFNIQPEKGEGNSTRIRVPGLVARDQLTYRYWGKLQNYDSASVRLECGALWLPSPVITFKDWWIGARFGGGLLAPVLLEPSGVRPAGEAEALLQKRFFNLRWAVEVDLAYMLGEKETRPIRGNVSDEATDARLVNRLFLSARASFAMIEEFQVVFGGGVMFEFPAERSDAGLMETIGGAFVTEGWLRYTPTRAFFLQVGTRFVIPERIRDFGRVRTDDGIVPAGTYRTPSFHNEVGFLIIPTLSLGLWGSP